MPNKEIRVIVGKRREDVFATMGSIAVELPPVDVSKIKEGDEIWVRTKVLEVFGRSFIVKTDNSTKEEVYFVGDNIIAHFPAQDKPQVKEDVREGKITDIIVQNTTLHYSICQRIAKEIILSLFPTAPKEERYEKGAFKLTCVEIRFMIY